MDGHKEEQRIIKENHDFQCSSEEVSVRLMQSPWKSPLEEPCIGQK